LLSNNPDRARQLARCGVTVIDQLPTGVHLSAANSRYLAAKVRHGAHTLKLPDPAGTGDTHACCYSLARARSGCPAGQTNGTK